MAGHTGEQWDKMVRNWQFEEWLRANYSPLDLILYPKDPWDYYQKFCKATQTKDK